MTRKHLVRRHAAARTALAGAMVAEKLESRVLLSTYSVTTAADSGDGSLRAEIAAANAAKSTGTITFNIPGSGVQTIALLSALPAVIGAVTIDGTTQPGYSGTPLIALDGSAAGPAADGLTLAGIGSGVAGVDIENFSGNGVVLQAGAANIKGNQFVRSCFVGTDPTGTLPRGNGQNGVLFTGTSATIGGGSGMGNLISANRGSGIVATGSSLVVAGNRIGTNLAGDAPLGNGREGIDVSSFGFTIGSENADQGNVISGNASSGIMVLAGIGTILGANRIGTNAAGTAALGDGFLPSAPAHDGITVLTSASVKIADAIQAGSAGVDNRNLISGNKAAGVSVGGSILTVTGSYIGTDVTGNGAIPNGTDGIYGAVSTDTNGINPASTMSGNVISGNGRNGIVITGGALTCSANLVGTNAAGNRAVPNGADGIQVQGNLFSFSAIGPKNVISGNSGDGILLNASADVFGNLIGVDASGTLPLGNASHGIETRSNATIGLSLGPTTNGVTATTPMPNVISANGGDGILANGGGSLWIAANLIGTNAAAMAAPGFGNGRDGVALYDSNGNTIGGSLRNGTSVGNVIADSGHNGVTIVNPSVGTVGTGSWATNKISQNSIYANDGLGIDLGDDGVTPNVPPAQQGPNSFEDFPVISTAVAQANNTMIAGSVQGPPSTQIVIEAFDNDHPDPSGYGQGQRFIGSVAVTTDATGNAQFQFNTNPAAPGTFVTTTATALNFLSPNTNPAPNTSEFSAAVQLQPAAAAAGPQTMPTKPTNPAARPAVTPPQNTYTVITTADSGDGSLRAAITAADAAKTVGTIAFDIASSGVQTIALLSALPVVTAPVTIDGTTQPGYSGTPLIALDGSSAGSGVSGLTFNAAKGGVRALDIEDFGGNGMVLGNESNPNPGPFVTGCFIGVDPGGTLPRGNGRNGIVVDTNAAVIGGDGGLGNVISANAGSGILVQGYEVQIAGNRIGTNAAGTAALGNAAEGIDVTGDCTIGGSKLGSGNVISGNGSSGVLLEGRYPNSITGANRIGTNLAGGAAIGNGFSPAARFHDGVTVVGNSSVGIGDVTVGTGTSAVIARNVISGNRAAGVSIGDGANERNGIVGTYIGIDATGSFAIGNGTDGVDLGGAGQLGFASDGNVISGNGHDGVLVRSNWTVAGNRIGTNAAGTAAIPNGGNGVEASFATVGPANVISGNAGDGILFGGAGTIVGNYIGVDASGIAPLGNRGNGVELRSNQLVVVTDGLTIPQKSGSVTSSVPNVISANAGSGLLINGYYSQSPRNIGKQNAGDQILGNLIGTNAAGIAVANMGNGSDGVTILDSSQIAIGAIGQGNTIAANGHNGISVILLPAFASGDFVFPANQISGNSIFSNAGLGIDIGDDGVSPNLPPLKGDLIPRQQQEFPVIALAAVTPNGTVIAGTMQGTPNHSIRVELFDNAVANPSGYGEGRWYLGQVTVRTDESGNASFELSTLPLTTGSFVTATATDISVVSRAVGNTSEFSRAVQVGAPPMVLQASFNGRSAPPSLSFQFSQNVSPLLSTGSLLVSNGPATVSVTGLTYDATTNTATFTLPSPLPGGSYQALIPAGSVLGSLLAPNQPGGGYAFAFSQVSGALAGGGVVDFADLVILARHYGMSGTYANGDINGDGRVDFQDLLLLARSYGRPLIA